MKLGVALHFCTDDAMFLPAILRECRKFTDAVVIAYYDHFFDGEPERLDIVSELIAGFPEPYWVRIPFPGKAKNREEMHKLHGLNRWHAVRAFPDNVTHALLLDSDEVPDGEAFNGYSPPKPALQFREIMYWRRPTLACRGGTGAAVMVERELWTHENFVSGSDRGNFPAKVVQEPMIHHFSWARPLEQIERKIRRWPNKEPALLEALRAEWSRPFGGRDCLRRSETRTYAEVPNRFGLPCSTT